MNGEFDTQNAAQSAEPFIINARGGQCHGLPHTHTHIHTQRRNPPPSSASELLCYQASQAEAFWTRCRPTLVREPESERGFQETS